MKIADVIKICKATKRVDIYNENAETKKYPDKTEKICYSGTQWIGNGAACYCMFGTPRIETEDEFSRQYDMTEKQKEGCLFTQNGYPTNVDFSPWTDDGIAAKPTQITIGTGRKVLRGISYGGELMLVDEKYLKPFEKSPDEAVEYEVRHMKNGTPYLYIREEMEPGAVIMPIKCKDNVEFQNTADELRNFWYEVKREIEADAEGREENK